jgi:hypothetical protein
VFQKLKIEVYSVFEVRRISVIQVKNKMRLTILLLMVLSKCWASEYFPKGCQAISISDDQMQFEVKPHHLLFFHNLSEKQIWLANANLPKLTRGLTASSWSVLYAPNLPLSWRCIQSEQGHEQRVSCQEVVAVCQWSAKAPKTMKQVEMLWLLENQTIVYSKAYLQRMGWLFDQKRSKLEKTVS